ncbi:MAG: sterol desaturase family protein [Thermoplasmata archaeon]|nr:MAG: sterol desaturase family protein [Thermoplasmata archaeon]
MELFVCFLYKFVIHGFLWVLHEDHHRPKEHRLQKNDIFSLFFSVLAFIFILYGILSGFNIYFWIGIGIIAYGIGYFMVHDIFFHRRIKIKYIPKSAYMKGILNAHGHHHMKATKERAINFGFLYANKKYNVPD